MRARSSASTTSRQRSARELDETQAVFEYALVVLLIALVTVALLMAIWASAAGVQTGTEAAL